MTMTKISFSSFAASVAIMVSLGLLMTARGQDDGPKTPLAEQMGGMAKDFRSLRKIVNNPAQKDAALLLVKDMESRATKAKGFEPAKTKVIPAAQKEQFIADFQKQIDGLIGDFQKLETAVSSGNTADASALLDKLQADKKEGHKKFNVENGGPRGGGRAGAPVTSGTAPQ
jgi:soluble cytochrome b562